MRKGQRGKCQKACYISHNTGKQSKMFCGTLPTELDKATCWAHLKIATLNEVGLNSCLNYCNNFPEAPLPDGVH